MWCRPPGRHRCLFFAVLLLLAVCLKYTKVKMKDNQNPGTATTPVPMIPSNSFSTYKFYKKMKIPKIVHQTWKTQYVPQLLQDWVMSWAQRNPGWEYWFWTDARMRQLIVQKFPDYLHLYDRYPTGIQRVDAFRYFLMYEYGGLYADLDVECLQPLDPVISKHECIITQEPLEHVFMQSGLQPPLVSNAVMACQPGHPFFLYIINHLQSFAGQEGEVSALLTTGPFMITKAFHNYQQMSIKRDQVYLASPEEFSPTFDNSRIGILKYFCLERAEKTSNYTRGSLDMFDDLCRKLDKTGYENKPSSLSYTNHHWSHMWADDPLGAARSNLTFDVNKVMDNRNKKSS